VRVLIIGGGTGGTSLAHGLKQAGVQRAVYERDRTRSEGLHGYLVGINSTGNRALQQCLPPELFATYLATCARSPRFFNVLTEKLSCAATVPLRQPSDPVDSERLVSRMTLRQVLFTGVDDIIHFDKAFTHYQQNDDGTVTAHFADGTSASGEVLVAADGANSAVRHQYLPHAEVTDAGIITIGGRSPSPPRPSRCCRCTASRACRWYSRPMAGFASGMSWSSSGTPPARSRAASAATTPSSSNDGPGCCSTTPATTSTGGSGHRRASTRRASWTCSRIVPFQGGGRVLKGSIVEGGCAGSGRDRLSGDPGLTPRGALMAASALEIHLHANPMEEPARWN
jgi:2-polyprenyl-6-methoxyphenol hydroxylase-like FAD-dependent oxidoreductase